MEIFQLIGLILLVISYITYKNTYSKESKYDYKSGTHCYDYEKLPSPLWGWILAFSVSIIPIFNIIIFTIAFISYCLLYIEDEIGFKPESRMSKILGKTIMFLNKDV